MWCVACGVRCVGLGVWWVACSVWCVVCVGIAKTPKMEYARVGVSRGDRALENPTSMLLGALKLSYGFTQARMAFVRWFVRLGWGGGRCAGRVSCRPVKREWISGG